MISCTVVIPLYNRRERVGRALDSALAQTRRDIEIIVVDDGSTDGGAQRVLERLDPRVRLVTQANAGNCAARNRGLEEARADWVAFLDSDDEWRPLFLERTLALAQAHPELVAVFSNILSVRENAPWLRLPFSDSRVLDDYFDLVIRNEGRGMTCSSSMVRKSAMERAGGFPEGVHRSGDLDAWFRLALTGEIGCVPEVLAAYHNEAPGMSALVPEPVFPEGVKTYRRLLSQGSLPERYSRPLRRLENLYLLIHARDLIDYGARERARRVLVRECAWRHCPPLPLAKALLRSLGS